MHRTAASWLTHAQRHAAEGRSSLAADCCCRALASGDGSRETIVRAHVLRARELARLGLPRLAALLLERFGDDDPRVLGTRALLEEELGRREGASHSEHFGRTVARR